MPSPRTWRRPRAFCFAALRALALLPLLASLSLSPEAAAQTPGASTTPPGTVLFSDNFEGRHKLDSRENANLIERYVDGEYEVQKVSSGPGGYASALPDTAADTTLAVDARLVGDLDGRYLAVNCRRGRSSSGPDGYALTVNVARGAVRLSKYEGGNVVTIDDWIPVPSIQPDESWIHLEMTCSGSIISAAVNGAQVAAVQDTTYTQGLSWLGTGTFDGKDNPSTARFDNLVVTQAAPLTTLPAPPPGTLLFSEDFQNPDDGWMRNSPDDGASTTYSYENGEFVVRHPDPPEPSYFPASVPGVYLDASLAVDVYVANDPVGQVLALNCRENRAARSAIRLRVAPSAGQFAVDWRENDGTKTLLPWTRSPSIVRDLGTNHIELVCAGPWIAVRVNGDEIGAVRDPKPLPGRFYIGGSVATDVANGFEAHFSNLTVVQQAATFVPASPPAH